MFGFLKRRQPTPTPEPTPEPRPKRRAVTFQVKCSRCGTWGKPECAKCWAQHEREAVFSFGAERGPRF